jgi:FkbM family methyltransferase
MQKSELFFKMFNYRGYSRLCHNFFKSLLPDTECIIKLNADTKFTFPIEDTYWVRLISNGFKYEPEIERVLKKICNNDFTFIDAGANFGYWSCLMTSGEYGFHKTISIEPSLSTFFILQNNAKINGNRFITERMAIDDTSGKTVNLGGSGHASMSILSDKGEAVTTISLDDLLSKHGVNGPIVLKLDVEGVEIEALKGANRALSEEALILYEDHGIDLENKVSAYLLNQGWKLYDIEGATPIPLKTIAEVSAVKVDRGRGYNFAASNTPWWI